MLKKLLFQCLLFGLSVAVLRVSIVRAVEPTENELNSLLPRQTVQGESYQLDDSVKFNVLVFLGVECPVARQYGAKLPPLAERYTSQPIQFIGINSNPQDSAQEFAQFQDELKIAFPMLKDESQQVARFFSVTRTAEVVVVDRVGKIHYRGRIDDQYSPGVTRGETTSHDLRDALDALVAGLPVPLAETPPVGCVITYRKVTADNPTVTFTRDVAPLLWSQCYECHRSGEIGPFDISNYDDLLGWGEMLVEVMEQKRMPPWHASPEYGSFKNERVLPAGSIDLIRRWIDEGMPYGDASDLPALPTYTEGWRLPREPDLVVEMRDRPFRVPADETVDYQYFVVDPGITEDRWISASQIIPGAPSVVHHSIVFVRPPEMDEFIGIGWLNAYVPGQVPVEYPPGYARKIPAGSRLVFQMHYTPSGVEQLDTTKIGLVFMDESEVTHQVFTSVAIDQDFEIPPHAESHTVTAEMQRFPKFGQLLAISPHMHLRGKSFEVFGHRGEQTQTILKVPHYDFNWQHTYEYRSPISLRELDSISISATFDNSKKNPFNPNPDDYVMWGDQTWEEMTLGYFDIAIPIQNPSAVSPSVQHPVSTSTAANADEESREALRPTTLLGSGKKSLMNQEAAERYADSFLSKYDANQDGQLTMREVPNVFRDYGFWLVDTNRDGHVSREELILGARGDLEKSE